MIFYKGSLWLLYRELNTGVKEEAGRPLRRRFWQCRQEMTLVYTMAVVVEVVRISQTKRLLKVEPEGSADGLMGTA